MYDKPIAQTVTLGPKSMALVQAGRQLQEACFLAAAASGWWTNLATDESISMTDDETYHPGQPDHAEPRFNVPEKMMLIVSEVAEAMEGYRKGQADDKLAHRSMLEVELADALIRIYDLAGALNLDIGRAMAEKLLFNATRADHSLAARKAEGGKKF